MPTDQQEQPKKDKVSRTQSVSNLLTYSNVQVWMMITSSPPSFTLPTVCSDLPYSLCSPITCSRSSPITRSLCSPISPASLCSLCPCFLFSLIPSALPLLLCCLFCQAKYDSRQDHTELKHHSDSLPSNMTMSSSDDSLT